MKRVRAMNEHETADLAVISRDLRHFPRKVVIPDSEIETVLFDTLYDRSLFR